MNKSVTPAHPANANAAASPNIENTSAHPRPPCRGCLPDCPNYLHCDGKPWRETTGVQ